MHARLDELLSLRDGEPASTDVRSHVASCAECSREVDRLRALRGRLRALPAAARPADAWDAIAGRAWRTAPDRRARRLVSAAAAASVLVAVATGWLLRETPAPAPAIEPVAQAAGESVTPDLVRRSIALENALRTFEFEPGIVRGSTAGTIAEIEDRIALVDYQLNYAAGGELTDSQSQRLWRQRVDLLSSLVQVRYAQAQEIAR